MLSVISPAKTLDFESDPLTRKHSSPAYLKHSKQLIQHLRACSEGELQAHVDQHEIGRTESPTLSDLEPALYSRECQAGLACLQGGCTGFQLTDYQSADYAFAQKHLRILSGLYGLLRPLDLIQPYRLEMGTSLKNQRGHNLYAFWGDLITKELNQAIVDSGQATLINLASNEYFQAILKDQLEAEVITPVFKDLKKGNTRSSAFLPKRPEEPCRISSFETA